MECILRNLGRIAGMLYPKVPCPLKIWKCQHRSRRWGNDAWMGISIWFCNKTGKCLTRNNYGMNWYITLNLLSQGVTILCHQGCNGAIDSEHIQNKIGNEVTLFLGEYPWFCRSIKFNRKIFLKVLKDRQDVWQLNELLQINDIFHFVEIFTLKICLW